MYKMPKANPEMFETLIEEVRVRECLYKPSHPMYKDRASIDNEWTSIGDILGISAEDAKRTWQNLRSSYSRCLAAGKSSSRPWYLKKQMDFLRPHMANGPHFSNMLLPGESYSPLSSTEASPSAMQDGELEEGQITMPMPTSMPTSMSSSMNMPMSMPMQYGTEDQNSSACMYSNNTPLPPPKMMKTDDSFNSIVDDPEHSTSSIPFTSTSTSKQRTGTKRKQPARTSPSYDPIAQFNFLREQQQSESDEDLMFFKGLLPTFKELSRINKRKFMRMVTNLLFDMIEAQETQTEIVHDTHSNLPPLD